MEKCWIRTRTRIFNTVHLHYSAPTVPIATLIFVDQVLRSNFSRGQYFKRKTGNTDVLINIYL